jgi:hypothetical protein
MPFYKLWLHLQYCNEETDDEPVYATVDMIDFGTFASLGKAQDRIAVLATKP